MAEDIAENSSLEQYQSKPRALCMNVADPEYQRNSNFLESSKKDLLKRYPKFEDSRAEARDFFSTIIQNVFVEGISKHVFIRNYTLAGNRNPRVAIRLQRTPWDYLSKFMPENKTLLFKGSVKGNFFVVDSVSDHYDEPLLPYEVECRIIRYDNQERVKADNGNFLYDLAAEAASLNEHTGQRLVEWNNYINWRSNIVKARMHGVPYIRVRTQNEYIVFTLRFQNREAYDSEIKWLKKSELAAYDEKQYSDDKGNFSYNEERNFREKLEPLGSMARNFKRQGREVGDHFEIDLVYNFPASDEFEEMSAEEREDYIQTRLLPRYPETGFLAPLVIKDLSLFGRLSGAVRRLQEDKFCRSPNMAMWIFDVKRARLPRPEDRAYWEEKVGNNWLNQKVAENLNQREAIFKMLEAPDLCLIQGPPGTGKTTVIAEAIYQLTKNGERVLLASQSHDAVDNALERLADRPEIRAVRLGERDRDRDEERSKFSQTGVLAGYYSRISNAISQDFLSRWNENRHNYSQCELELRDWRHISTDLEDLNRELTTINDRRTQLKLELKQAQSDRDNALSANNNHENAKRQYRAFADMAAEGNFGEEFYLPPEFGEILAQEFVPVLNFARENGILLASSVNSDVIQRDINLSLKRIAKDSEKLARLRDKLSQIQKNAGVNDSINQLKIQELNEAIRRISEQMEDDGISNERWTELKNERKRLREEKQKIGDSVSVSFSEDELSLLAAEIQEKINQTAECENLTQTATEIIRLYREALNNFIRRIGEKLDSYQPPDVRALDERVKSCRGQLKQLEEDSSRKQTELIQKEQLGVTLAQKYRCERDEIESRIENELARLNDEWAKDAEIRQVWKVTLEKFAQKLNDEQTVRYDKEYYQDIYIRSCNVVGITCTANMKELDEIFYDFDVVIIDEVSKATPPELLTPLMKARKTILVGDHRQLPPVFNEYQKPYNELIEELNARQAENESESDEDDESPLKPEDLQKYRDMVTSSLFREYFEQADDKIKHSLLTQYRMHSDIQRIINRFYDGKLVSGIIDRENEIKAHGLNILTERGESFLRPDSHAYWIDSSKLRGKIMLQSQYSGSDSLHNIFEKYIILSVLQEINDACARIGKIGVTVGVISFYGSQVGDLRKAVKELRNQGKLKALRVDVNTVDRFQGKEKQIIITSLVCNTTYGNASRHVTAFERINVAFSRAQNLLIIVGAKELYRGLKVPIPSMDTGELRSSRIYQGIIDDIAGNGALISGEILISENDVNKIFDEYAKEAAES